MLEPFTLVIVDVGSWHCRSTLAMGYARTWDCRFTLAMVYDGLWDAAVSGTFFRDLSYVSPRRWAVWDSASVYTGLGV